MGGTLRLFELLGDRDSRGDAGRRRDLQEHRLRTDVDCPPSQHCNGSVCVDDTCASGARTCVGDELHECAPNGSGAPISNPRG